MSLTQFLAPDRINHVSASAADPLPVAASNITAKFRVAFETPELPAFTVVTGTGDIVQTDGNAQAASYVSISKSPWNAGTETSLTTLATFGMPVELAFGASRSQATLGQEFAFELVDTGTPLPDVADIAIASISQTTTTLTIDTVADHGLVPGKSIGVVGCSDQRANYPSLVVATIPSPRQITCTAGPGGTIASQTIANPAGAKGSIYFRERLGRANDGMSQIFENASAAFASYYIRSRSGDALASGTPNGNHASNCATTASVQAINAPYTYAFAPSSEYRLNLQADRVQAMDSAVDATAQATSRVLRTQVCPDPDSQYKFRIRATNNKALTVLTAKVVSVVKTGTTTGTFTTLTPHGLTTNDLIVYYGNSNTAASAFPNVVTATAVTVVDATTFTMVIGTAATVTGYGGVIAKIQGGNLLSALGAVASTAINATLTTLTDGTRQLVLNGSANWTGPVIGDYVEVAGVTNVSNGATLGVDGTWKVANTATTVLTLVPVTPEFAATLPADFTITNSGGAVVRRTCLRVSFARIFAYERQRVEMLARPSADASAAAPVVAQGGTLAASQSGTWNIGAVTTAGVPPVPATPFSLNSAATTNGSLIITGTSGLQSIYATNTGAGAAYVKLYNKATAPTVGTDTPLMIIPIPAAAAGVPGVSPPIQPGYVGLRFPLGLGIAITGGAADSDTTAVTAGQVKVILSRTV